MSFKHLLYSLLLLTAFCISTSAQAYCFQEAGARYHVSPQLLRAIAQVESGMNPHAIGYNRNRQGNITSRDFGLMQINSTHLAKLKAMGGLTWQCLGSYNAGFADGNQARRMLYARKVYSIWLASR